MIHESQDQKIHVSRKQMRKSFNRHRNLWNTSSGTAVSHSHKMVLFYAIECGLKYLYMERWRLETTSASNSRGESITDFGHNLNSLLEQLHLENFLLPQTEDENGQQISPKKLHQAWRYGRELDTKKEDRLLEKMKKILAELNAKIL